MANKEINKFHPINKFFDKIYIVTLKKSLDRHEVFKKRLKGLNFEIFWGVDGKKEDIEVLEGNGVYNHKLYHLNRLINQEPSRKLNMGRVGCALSHVSIYKDIVEKKYSRVLILEDDVTVVEKYINDFEKGILELPGECDLLYLGHYGSHKKYSNAAKLKFIIYKFLNSCGLKKYDPINYRNLFPRPYSNHLVYAGYHWGTHAYSVTLNGARKILGYQQPITREADNILAELCKYELIKAYSFKNHVFVQDTALESTIVNK
jgi:glycosyl transferase family 25